MNVEEMEIALRLAALTYASRSNAMISTMAAEASKVGPGETLTLAVESAYQAAQDLKRAAAAYCHAVRIEGTAHE